MRAAAALLLAVLAAPGCSEEPPPAAPPQHPPIPAPPPRPATAIMTADFRALFVVEARSRSVYMPTRDPDWGKRVLLGPNLVFEASRGALGEPPAGAADAVALAPEQHDALGAPVDVALSSQLLVYLASKGSTVLAPAVVRRWSPEGGCAKDACAPMTWVERALLAQRAHAGGTKDAPRVDELPTAMLAVRQLGRTTTPTDVIVQEDGATLRYRFRGAQTDASVCPPMSFDVPVVAFEAEIVSVRDGRILARIQETRQIAIPSQAWTEIEAFVPAENPEAVTALRQYADIVSHGQWSSPLPRVPYWLRTDVRCRNGEDAFRRIAQQVVEHADAEQDAAVTQMLAKALDPMFAAPPPEDAKPAKGKPKAK
jgi:hypothetical protein